MTRIATIALLVATLASTSAGQAYSVWGQSRLFVTGDTSPGGTIRMVCSSPLDKSKGVVFIYSSAIDNPFILPDGRSLGINVYQAGTSTPDPIFLLTSVNGLGAEPYFGTPLPQQTTFDIVGTASRTISVYNSPLLIGATIYSVALTLDAGAPSGIGRISAAAAITFRDPAVAIHYIRIANLPGVPLWSGSQSGTLGGIMQGTTSGICRIKAQAPPPAGKGGIEEHSEMFEVRGWNNGPNGVPENGAGDDVPLGPVPCTFTKSFASNSIGVIDASTGMFTAGHLTTTAANGAAGGYGTVTATLAGNPTVTATKDIRVVPPSWVSPPLASPTALTAQVVSSTVVLNWTNPVSYTSIDITRNGTPLVSGLPGSTTSYIDSLNTSGVYGVRGHDGAQVSPWTFAGVGVNQIPLGDDDSVEVPLGFSFTYFGNVWNTVWVNANGNCTFGAASAAYGESSSAFASAPPRVAGIWDDLNPGAGGMVVTSSTATSLRVDWFAVPQYGGSDSNTFWIEFRSSGQIQIGWGSVALLDGLVGIGNGSSSAAEVNFSSVALPYTGAAGARIYERFSGASDPFDLDNLSRTFTPVNAGVTQYQMTSP